MIDLPQDVRTALVASTRFIVCQVKIYFDGEEEPPVVLSDNDIMSCRLFSETGNRNDSFVGKVCSGSLDLTIENKDGRFSPTNENSPYYGKLVEGVKIEVSALVDVDLKDNFYEIPMGVFYAAEWTSAAGALECDILAFDRLYWWLNVDLPVLPMIRGTTGAELIRHVMEKLRIPRVNIDNALQVPITFGFFTSTKVGDVFAELCVGCGAIMYIDRYDVLQVKSTFIRENTPMNITDANWLYEVQAIPTLQKQFDTVTVGMSNTGSFEIKQIASFSDLEMPTGEKTFTDLVYTNGPVVNLARITVVGNSTRLKSYTTGAQAGTFTLENTGAPENVQLNIYGKCLVDMQSNVTVGENLDERSMELSVKSRLIQNDNFAKYYASALYNLGNTIIPQATLEARGIPQIDMHDLFKLDSTQYKMTVQMTPIQITHDFQEGMSTTIVCAPHSLDAVQGYEFILPTFPIKDTRNAGVDINAKFKRR